MGPTWITPALFTSTSIRPKRRRLNSTNRFTWARSATSQGTVRTSAPSLQRSSSAARSSDSSLAQRMSEQPALAKPLASARPNPRDPPEIRTTLPIRSIRRRPSHSSARPPPSATPDPGTIPWYRVIIIRLMLFVGGTRFRLLPVQACHYRIRQGVAGSRLNLVLERSRHDVIFSRHERLEAFAGHL